MCVPHIAATFDDIARTVIDQSRAARPAARRIVVAERRLIFDRARPPAYRDVAARKQRIGVMRAKLGLPRKLPRKTVGAIDDIGDLPRQAWNIERRAIDDLDPLDIARGNTRQLGVHVVTLVRRSLAVEQHITRRLPQSAQIFIVADLKARNLTQHVIRVVRRIAREVGGCINLSRRAADPGSRRFGRGRRRRIAGWWGLLRDGRNGRKRGGKCR
jgi:hypothetical protein